MRLVQLSRQIPRCVASLALVAGMATAREFVWSAEPTKDNAAPLQTTPGERVPSEDTVVNDLHSLGLVEGRSNIFRSACPVRDLAEAPADKLSDTQKMSKAQERMRHLRELGVRTIVSFEDPGKGESQSSESQGGSDSLATAKTIKPSVSLERGATESENLRFISIPMNNSGAGSLQDMSDEAVLQMLEANSRAVLDAAKDGGVLFHCSAGHDRTGIISAYIRMKYQHWPVEEAIAEMRRYGHNWPKFSTDGGQSSWHEAHLREIDKMLKKQAAAAAGGDKGDSHGQ
jgi:hypothetical protein